MKFPQARPKCADDWHRVACYQTERNEVGEKKSRHADITRGRFVCDPASGDGWQDVGSKRTDYCDCIFMHPVVGNGRVIGICFSCILVWATAVIPGLLVLLLFFFLSTLLTPVPTAQIFSGFASSAFWLVFSGSAIGFALKESGLSDRIGI